jgi:hypothetical protein
MPAPIAFASPLSVSPRARRDRCLDARTRDVWCTLEQSELAAALSALALGVTLGVDRRLYAMHHPISAFAFQRLRRWQIPAHHGGSRAPWSLRHTPVVHGGVLALLVTAGSRPNSGTSGPAATDAANSTLADRLADLARVSAERIALLAVPAANAPDAEDVVTVRLQRVSARAIEWIAGPADLTPAPRSLAAVTGAARIVLAVELVLAVRRLRTSGILLPLVLERAVARLQPSVDAIVSHALASDDAAVGAAPSPGGSQPALKIGEEILRMLETD